jgi:mono/diheme cytochrome c family protein
MKRIVRLAAFVSAGAVIVLGAVAAGAVWLGERKLQRTVLVKVVPVPYASGPAALKQGKYLFESRGCAECHGANGGGREMINDPNGMYVKTPNITVGGATSQYSEADWVRAIRHGIDPRGRALVVMPSEDYNRLTDADFSSLVAYVRSLPAAPPAPAQIHLPAIVKALYGLGVIPDAAERINHALPPSQPVAAAANVEHGHYVAQMCIGCHGEHLAGGKIPGGPPDWPPAANLTPGDGSVMPRYDSPEKFVAMMRTGKRPDASPVNKAMPFETLKAMNDIDLNAVYVYLKALAPRATGK